MLKLVGVLLALWLAFIVIGALVKGLLWLVFLGAVLFVVTGALGIRKGRATR